VSWALQINGHKDQPAEQAKAYEEKIAAAFEKAVAGIDGVESAVFQGSQIGGKDLKK
jgi:hypothetical protein